MHSIFFAFTHDSEVAIFRVRAYAAVLLAVFSSTWYIIQYLETPRRSSLICGALLIAGYFFAIVVGLALFGFVDSGGEGYGSDESDDESDDGSGESDESGGDGSLEGNIRANRYIQVWGVCLYFGLVHYAVCLSHGSALWFVLGTYWKISHPSSLATPLVYWTLCYFDLNLSRRNNERALRVTGSPGS